MENDNLLEDGIEQLSMVSDVNGSGEIIGMVQKRLE